MVVMKLKADNLYDFNDFSVEFSYPKKIVGNPLEKEYLKNFPNFRYRRFNVIIGANSTGKTTLGQLLNSIFVLLNRKEISGLIDCINDKNRKSSFEIDIVLKDILYRTKCVFPSHSDGDNRSNIKLSIRSTPLVKNDSYETAVKRLEEQKEEYLYYVDALEKQMHLGWNFSFPENSVVRYNYNKNDEETYRRLLESILKVFDPSISKVVIDHHMERGFYIYFNGCENDPLVVEDNRPLSSIRYMSSGTKAAFNITDIIWGLKKDAFGFYYLDEQFSFVNSEIELALIAHLSGYTNNDDQIFITTHNVDVLDMDFPVHTFGFLKKTIIEKDKDIIKYINASEYEKRNTASIKQHYKNDCFSVLPDLSGVYKLGEIN